MTKRVIMATLAADVKILSHRIITVQVVAACPFCDGQEGDYCHWCHNERRHTYAMPWAEFIAEVKGAKELTP